MPVEPEPLEDVLVELFDDPELVEMVTRPSSPQAANDNADVMAKEKPKIFDCRMFVSFHHSFLCNGVSYVEGIDAPVNVDFH